METKLKFWSIRIGGCLVIVSAFFSFSGFSFNFDSPNSFITIVLYAVGLLLTVTVSILQFIFNSDIRGLNWTLKIIGLLSYIYSIWTNYKGLNPFVNIDGDDVTTMIVAGALDILPEPMIAWGMGEALRGDLIGNLLKMLGIVQTTKNQNDAHERFQNHRPRELRHKDRFRSDLQPTIIDRLPKRTTPKTGRYPAGFGGEKRSFEDLKQEE